LASASSVAVSIVARRSAVPPRGLGPVVEQPATNSKVAASAITLIFLIMIILRFAIQRRGGINASRE
jgi:hypothetical protein